jgi:hypothetical protein
VSGGQGGGEEHEGQRPKASEKEIVSHGLDCIPVGVWVM